MGLGNLFGRKPPADLQSYIEVMLFLAMADGELEEDEINDFINTCIRHPRLKAMPQREFSTAVDRALRNIEREGIDKRMNAICQTLQKREDRMDAMEMAMSISMSDGTIEPEEMTILRKIQSSFGLSDTDIDELIQKINS